MTIQQVQPTAETTCDRRAGESTTAQPRHERWDGFDAHLRWRRLDAVVHRWLHRYSLSLLRISMGAVIFGFGVLKYFPGVSPAQDLVLATTRMLTFGLVPGNVAMVLFATVECIIGLSLVTGRGLRVSIYLTALWVLGILSPLVVLPGRMFNGPHHAPTLEGQYVLKDLVLLTATLVIATTVRRRAAGRELGRQTERGEEELAA